MIGKTIKFSIDIIDKDDRTRGQTTASGVVIDSVLIDGTTYYLTKLSDDMVVLVYCKDVLNVR